MPGIATPERDRLTASQVHQVVDHRPITRYDVAGGYLDPTGLAIAVTTTITEEETP